MRYNLNIKLVVLNILLILTALSYHPIFSNVVVQGTGKNPLNTYITVMAILTFTVFANVKEMLKNVFFVKYIRCLFFVLVFAIVISCFKSSDYFVEFKNILMSLIFLSIGYCLRFDEKKIMLVVYVYSLTVIYCTYCQIINNFGGFIIADVYMKYGKNTLGVMAASSCISCMFIAYFETSKLYKTIGYILSLTLFFFTVTIRARAAFLTVFLVFCIFFSKGFKNIERKKIIMSIAAILFFLVTLALVSSDMFSAPFDYIYSSFTQNQGDDLTSDRLNRNSNAFSIIVESPFWGNLTLDYKYDWVHNYFLRQLSSYGFIGSIPLLVLYCYIVKTVFKNLTRGKLDLSMIGMYVITVPLVISLEEPTFPYAPGTGSILPFLLLGYTLRCYKKRLSDQNHI